jgi:cytochrome c oxidase assembly protein subunit 15
MDSQSATALGAPGTTGEQRARFTRYAWALLGYTLLVILFGAVVRITGSGAGCGQHWPSCNGELLQLPRTLKTTIEYAHRVSSGLSVLSIIGLLAAAFLSYPRGHAVRAAACVAFAMILVEALIGALLVKLRLVENDASFGRILVLPLHLSSTAVLTAALTWCAYFSSRDVAGRRAVPRGARLLLLFSGFGILLVSATGAVTALGDTVYPVLTRGFSARLHEDQGTGATLLQRMRDIHPLLALAVAAFVAYSAALIPSYCSGRAVKRTSQLLAGAVCLQVLAGVVNIGLSAPGPIQVVHLFLANLAWISLILLSAAARSAPTARTAPSARR